MFFSQEPWGEPSFDIHSGLLDLFNELDTNRDGRLDSAELHVRIRPLLQYHDIEESPVCLLLNAQ